MKKGNIKKKNPIVEGHLRICKENIVALRIEIVLKSKSNII